MIGGVVLTQLTTNYLAGWGRNKAPADLTIYQRHNDQTKDRDEVDSAAGTTAPNECRLSWLAQLEIASINGTPLKNLAHAIEIIDTLKKAMCASERPNGHALVLDITKARQLNPEILKEFNIPSARSTGL